RPPPRPGYPSARSSRPSLVEKSKPRSSQALAARTSSTAAPWTPTCPSGKQREVRRFFNVRERVALYLAADGKCQLCGTGLQKGWHADHIVPFSRNGDTDIANAQALCPPATSRKEARPL